MADTPPPADQLLFVGKIFRVVRKFRRLPDGTDHARDIVEHPGAVVILPLLGDDRLLLIRNHRPAVERTLWELPAGTLEPGEPPIETARRELAEETGYRCGRMEPLLEFFMSPGMLSERMYLFAAHDLTPGRRQLEPGEEIECHTVERAEALRMVREGEIEDAKTLVALLFHEQQGPA